jgi:Zn-dependent protease
MWSGCSRQSAGWPPASRDSISCLGNIDIAEVLIQLVVLIASLSVHEAAHAWAADRLGDPTARHLGRLSLNPAVHVDPIGTLLFPLISFVTSLPLIGWAKPVPVDPRYLKHPKRDFALIAAAGPASNVIMAVIGAVILALLPDTPPGDITGNAISGPMEALLRGFVIINVLLALFNMLPIPPLDGGNVLIGVLPDSLGKFVEALRQYGFLILYALMLTGALNFLLGDLAYFLLRLLLGLP